MTSASRPGCFPSKRAEMWRRAGKWKILLVQSRAPLAPALVGARSIPSAALGSGGGKPPLWAPRCGLVAQHQRDLLCWWGWEVHSPPSEHGGAEAGTRAGAAGCVLPHCELHAKCGPARGSPVRWATSSLLKPGGGRSPRCMAVGSGELGPHIAPRHAGPGTTAELAGLRGASAM